MLVSILHNDFLEAVQTRREGFHPELIRKDRLYAISLGRLTIGFAIADPRQMLGTLNRALGDLDIGNLRASTALLVGISAVSTRPLTLGTRP